jgi:hypothetical protein
MDGDPGPCPLPDRIRSAHVVAVRDQDLRGALLGQTLENGFVGLHGIDAEVPGRVKGQSPIEVVAVAFGKPGRGEYTGEEFPHLPSLSHRDGQDLSGLSNPLSVRIAPTTQAILESR